MYVNMAESLTHVLPPPFQGFGIATPLEQGCLFLLFRRRTENMQPVASLRRKSGI